MHWTKKTSKILNHFSCVNSFHSCSWYFRVGTYIGHFGMSYWVGCGRYAILLFKQRKLHYDVLHQQDMPGENHEKWNNLQPQTKSLIDQHNAIWNLKTMQIELRLRNALTYVCRHTDESRLALSLPYMKNHLLSSCLPSYICKCDKRMSLKMK